MAQENQRINVTLARNVVSSFGNTLQSIAKLIRLSRSLTWHRLQGAAVRVTWTYVAPHNIEHPHREGIASYQAKTARNRRGGQSGNT